MTKHSRGSAWKAALMCATVGFGLTSCAGSDEQPSPDDPGQPGSPTTPTTSDPKNKVESFKQGEVLVRFKSGVGKNRSASLHAKFTAQVLREYRVPTNLQLVQVPSGTSVEQAVAAYRKDPDVLYAEPNYVYSTDRVPNDPSFRSNWGLDNSGQGGGLLGADINAPEAWDITTGDNNVIIGLLDTGIDYNHADLAGNIWVNPGEIAGNGIDDDRNGYVDDVHGISAVNNDGNPMDREGHGTHVAGTMAAKGNNGLGIAGVAWNAKVVTCSAFNPTAALDDLLQCMDYFLVLKTRTTNPVNIVATNNSWGGGTNSQALLDAITAHKQAGMLFIAAAGNDGVNNDLTPHYPSSYELDNIISVSATDNRDGRASFSNYGAGSVDIAAPGDNVISTLPGNTYGAKSGTSMATPHVTGLVALLKAQDPGRTASQIKNLILTGGSELAAQSGLSISARRISADASLSCDGNTLVRRVQPTTSEIVVGIGKPVSLSMLAIQCDSALRGEQAVTVVGSGASIALRDAAGSGVFTGSFTPTELGRTQLEFPTGEVVSVLAVGNYDPAVEVPFEFPTIAGQVLALGDDASTPVTLPFAVPFGGAEPGFTVLNVGSNGILSFDTAVTAFGNLPLPSTAAQTLIAPHWDDLFPPEGEVRFAVIGTAPNRRAVVQYTAPHFQSIDSITFQVVFTEGSANVQFNYADTDFGAAALNNGASATVGVQSTVGIAQQFSFNTPSLRSNLSLLFAMGAPTASAGPDQVVPPLAEVHLSGSGVDRDGEVVSFQWTQTAGTPVALNNADTLTPFFTAPFESGTLTFLLTVTDDEGKTGSDSVNVIVNRAPEAAANADFEVATGLVGTLDASSSTDPDGTVTGFAWRQVSGERVTVINPNSAVATFVAPSEPQFLAFEVTVTDDDGFTDSELVIVDVFLNFAPTADAGQGRIVRPGSTVTLDGTGSSDEEGPIAAYRWTVAVCVTATGPCTVTLTGADTATPSFTAPSTEAIIRFNLTVTDRAGATATDSVTVIVALQPPVAAAVASACAQEGSTITLDGSISTDADGGIVSYSWLQLSGPSVVLNGADSARATFTGPSAGTLVFQLTVTDGDGQSDSTTVSVTIDQPPTARATAPLFAVAGTTATLDGSASIDAASYSWRQTAGTAVSLTAPSSATTQFVAVTPASGQPEVATFELTVTDSCGASSTTTVSIVIVPATGGSR